MPSSSDRFALPLLDAGQAQKEIFHNEALTTIDLLLHGTVIDHGLDTPPTLPAAGECWIVGPSPSGAWTGAAGKIAGWTGGGWRLVAPRAGLQLWNEAGGTWIHHDGTQWSIGQIPATAILIGGVQVVGVQAAAIADPSGGGTIDTQARATLSQLLSALRTHGIIAA